MSDFSTIYNEVLRRADLDVTADTAKIAEAKLWVNKAQRRLQIIRRWNVLYKVTSFVTTASDTSSTTYTLGARSTPGILWHETDSHPQEIFHVSEKDWVESRSNIDSEGRPQIYHIVSNALSSTVNATSIKLWPVSDDVYTVYDSYYTRVTDMSADADVPTFPNEFDEIISILATYYALISRGSSDLSKATYYYNQFKMELSELKLWDDQQINDEKVLRMRDITRFHRRPQDDLVLPIV